MRCLVQRLGQGDALLLRFVRLRLLVFLLLRALLEEGASLRARSRIIRGGCFEVFHEFVEIRVRFAGIGVPLALLRIRRHFRDGLTGHRPAWDVEQRHEDATVLMLEKVIVNDVMSRSKRLMDDLIGNNHEINQLQLAWTSHGIVTSAIHFDPFALYTIIPNEVLPLLLVYSTIQVHVVDLRS